jgi:energy-coupling factor transporter ATP-binding protein EcfA2
MKISRIVIRGYQQFDTLDLDLTDPKTGQALDRVCFIGRNGTGKTTLLNLINRILKRFSETRGRPPAFPELRRLHAAPLVALKLQAPNGGLCLVATADGSKPSPFVVREDTFASTAWKEFLNTSELEAADAARILHMQLVPEDDAESIVEALCWKDSGTSLLIHVPPDTGGHFATKEGVPQTTLNLALKLFKQFPLCHEVSTPNASAFWNVLIYHIKKREEDWQNYLQQAENRSKPVEEVDREFQRTHPDILAAIAGLWNRILEPAGLEFDYHAATKPVQLNENLEAFIKVKSSGACLEYRALSSGIRDFLFRLGHILSLYFARAIERAVLLLDEPENSLFPDFLYDQVEICQEITRNTQFFVATHSPIVAVQFRPEERVILEFDETYHVRAKRGVTPLGDDPNDVLAKDFEVRSIYGQEGLRQWERFLELRRTIKQAKDPKQKRSLIDEYMQIGTAYNFGGDAVSQEVS